MFLKLSSFYCGFWKKSLFEHYEVKGFIHVTLEDSDYINTDICVIYTQSAFKKGRSTVDIIWAYCFNMATVYKTKKKHNNKYRYICRV